MGIDFSSVVSAPASGRSTALIVDHQKYAQAVILRGNPIPWHDVTLYTNFFGQAQGLLRPDTALLDLGAFYANLLTGNEKLLAEMSTRTRVGYALKILLADETTATRALEFATVVAQTSKVPLVLQIPSPMRWLAQTHELSGAGSHADIEPDHGENVSVYVAGWLRRLSSLPVSLLLLDSRRADFPDLPEVELGTYTPITNAAEHYRWSVAQRTDDAVEVAGASLKGVAVPREYWLAEDVAVPSADFLIAEIPGRAAPETVLARLADLG